MVALLVVVGVGGVDAGVIVSFYIGSFLVIVLVLSLVLVLLRS